MSIKYIAFGGYVYSSDGDRHYVSAREVIRLYNVNPKQCTIAPMNRSGWSQPANTISLYPDPKGDYKQPTPQGE